MSDGAPCPVALVLVSHSAALAAATETLARQMTGETARIFVAAGVGDDGRIHVGVCLRAAAAETAARSQRSAAAA